MHWFTKNQIAPPTRETVTGLVLMSDTPETGSFSCDHDLLNQLQNCIRWGQRSNFLEVPTDCPQRDERSGWTGDAQIFAPTAAYNAEVAAFFTKWNRDVDDAQGTAGEIPRLAPNIVAPDDSGPGWADARVIAPWAMYQAYGDRRMLERHYPSIKRWLAYLEQTSCDGLRCGPWQKTFQHGGHASVRRISWSRGDRDSDGRQPRGRHRQAHSMARPERRASHSQRETTRFHPRLAMGWWRTALFR